MTRAQLHKNIDCIFDSPKVDPVVKQYFECLIRATVKKNLPRKPGKKAGARTLEDFDRIFSHGTPNQRRAATWTLGRIARRVKVVRTPKKARAA